METSTSTDALTELLAAMDERRRAEARIREICGRIAGDGEGKAAGRTPTVTKLGPGTARTRRAQKATQAAAAKPGRTPKVPREPGQIDQPWKKVTCAECGAQTGSRLVNDVRYPTGHYKPGTQIVCPGRSKPALQKEQGTGQ